MSDADKAMSGELKRDPKWAELSIEQKVERLRHVLRQLAHRMDNVEPQIHATTESFAMHEHGADGRVVLPYVRSGSTLANFARSEEMPLGYRRRSVADMLD